MKPVNFEIDGGFLTADGDVFDTFDNCPGSLDTQGLDVSKGIFDKPLTTGSFNAVLDTESNYCRGVDLLKHLDDDHLLKKLALQTAACCQMLVNTVFLVLMGVFSSVSCRKWVVDYQYGGYLPIGIYAVVEQPSATGKTRVVTTGQKPFIRIKDEVVKAYRENVKQLQEVENPSETQQEDLKNLIARKPAINSRLFISNATAEGMEQTLNGTDGFFSAISSEQGLFNSLLGLSYSKGDPNNDLVLNGFDGGHISSCRVTRDGYHGYVIGGVTLFAQQGSIEKTLSCSNGVGLSERFLMLAEPHMLGHRDHLKKVHIDPTLEENYATACEFSRGIFNEPQSADDLLHLKITDTGHRLIAEYRNTIEPHLADGGRYSHISLRGAAGKINIQVMKIAANLYLLDRRDDFDPHIPDSIVKAAIGIAHDLLEANLALCKAKGLIGTKAEFTTILSLFEKDRKPLTERQVIRSKIGVSPFKDFTGNKSDLIRETLGEMVAQKLLAKLMMDGVMQYVIKQ
ncbi:MAG: DUF3987 domain-containing protein [Methylobacter sp.]|nr:DUF3987 domain-containing protein [Methylobacter sp.]